MTGNIARIKCGNGNCYIVSERENAVLIDTCKSEYRDKILNVCKTYNIRLIVLTHGHFDHCQNAAYLSERLGAPIAMHQADFDLIKDNFRQKLTGRGIPGKIILSASVKSFRQEEIPPFKPTVWLSGGDNLDDYGIAGKVVHLPGHTDGSIGIDVDEKHLFVGDALMNMFYPALSHIYHDENELRKSAEKITALGERTVYFGHGKPVGNKIWVK